LYHSEVSTGLLISFDGLEKGLEVASTETLMVSALDDFEEESWSVLEGLREDLEQVTLVIVVDKDLLTLEHIDVLLNLNVGGGKTGAKVVVVSIGDLVKEQDTTVLHAGDRLNDGFRAHGDVLNTGTSVVVAELLDLTLTLAIGRLVDGHLDLLVEINHDD